MRFCLRFDKASRVFPSLNCYPCLILCILSERLFGKNLIEVKQQYQMDEYIKRKRRINDQQTNVKHDPESSNEVRLRQSKNQVQDLVLKLKYIEERTNSIKQVLTLVKSQIQTGQSFTHSKLLVASPSQKSPVTNQVFDGKASISNGKIQQNRKLESNEIVVDKLSAPGTQLNSVEITNEKYEQLGQTNTRKKRSRI